MSFHTLERLLTQAVPRVAPAIVCRVEQGGRLLFQQAYGWLDPEAETEPAAEDALFDLASLTKLFTTTLFLQAVDAGLTRLDAPLADVIPEFGGKRVVGGSEDPLSKQPLPADPRWAGQTVDAGRITFRQLLTHTSGLPAWRSIYRSAGPVPLCPPGPDIQARQQRALDAIVGYPFAYPPGEAYAYSDVGLILVGFAVARLFNAGDLAEAFRTRLAEPLGLTARYRPGLALQPRTVPTEICAWRQRRLRGEVHDENAAGLGCVAGHAGLFAPAQDVAHLGRIFLAQGQGLISAELAGVSVSEQVRSPDGVRRGVGWQLRSDPDPSCSTAFSPASFGHTGFTGTSLWCDPTRSLCVTLLANRVYHGRDAAGIIELRPAVHRAVVEALG